MHETSIPSLSTSLETETDIFSILSRSLRIVRRRAYNPDDDKKDGISVNFAEEGKEEKKGEGEVWPWSTAICGNSQ